MIYLNLLVMLIVILVAAEIFTNALEHLGQKLNISEGVTGSIFAAVGTAMPEASIPLIAILGTHSSIDSSHEIGIGAILGAPLMLSTIAMAIMALSVVKKRGVNGMIIPEKTGAVRDLNYFLIAYLIAITALFIPHSNEPIRFLLGFGMASIYFIYILQTVKASSSLVKDGHQTKAEHPLMLTRLGFVNNVFIIIVQVILGLLILFFGAKGFIKYIDEVAALIGIPVIILSILIIPIATELPEKVNSVLWIRRGKDTMAFGNISGAMVFQGTLLPAIGIILTPWESRPEIWTVLLVTIISTVWIRKKVTDESLQVWHLILCIIPYLIYLIIVFGK